MTKAAAVFMVGSFGEILQEAPYILEELIEEWDKHEAKVKNQLLVAALKLFFKVQAVLFNSNRHPETQRNEAGARKIVCSSCGRFQ